MKRVAGITTGVMLALALVSPTNADDRRPTPARLGLHEGDVLMQLDGADAWVTATANLPLGVGDTVWVPGRGRAEIQLPTGPAIRLGTATRLAIGRLVGTAGGIVEVTLDRGTTRIAGEQPLPGSALRIHLPSAIVHLGGAAAVRLDVDDEGTGRLAVERGEASVETTHRPVGAGAAGPGGLQGGAGASTPWGGVSGAPLGGRTRAGPSPGGGVPAHRP